MRTLLPTLICSIFCLSLFVSSCTTAPDADVAGIEIELDLVRTDSLLLTAAKAIKTQADLPAIEVARNYLASERSFFFQFITEGMDPAQVPLEVQDSIIAQRLVPFLADANTYFLLDTIQKTIPYSYPLAERLSYPLKRFAKYFPEIALPKFRTHVSGYSPDGHPATLDQTDYVGPYASLGLHYFMGSATTYYSPNIPAYLRRKLDLNYLEVVLANDLAEGVVRRLNPQNENKLLDQMIYGGVKLYVMDKLLPHTPDSMLLNYTSPQMLWADLYEVNVYNELLPNLYSTNVKLINDFTGEKPYTTQLSRESAPRIGHFAGWKIVEAYMRKNRDLSLEELCRGYQAEEILKEAKYKP